MVPVARIQLSVGWGRDLAADREQGAKGIERINTAIEPEGELVERRSSGRDQQDIATLV